MFRRLRWPARVAVFLAVLGIAALIGFEVFRLVQAAPSDATAQRLTIAEVIAASLSALSALAATTLAMEQRRSRRAAPLTALRHPKLLREDQLVNRDLEMRELVTLTRTARVISCHGARGAGKSFLLEHLTDVVNGHRPASGGQPKLRRISAALYFDLADAAGFADLEAQVCRAALGDAAAGWSDFVSAVESQFGRRRAVLVLDNVNSPGIWRQLGSAVHDYCARRPNDRLLLGSIDPVALNNMDVARVHVAGLGMAATGELVAQRGVALDEQQLAVLHSDCKGLPLYLRLLTAQADGVHLGQGIAVLDQQLIPELPPPTRRLLAHMSLLALVERRIALPELRRASVAELETQLRIADKRTLITEIPGDESRYFKVHDIVRDAALRVLAPEVAEAAHLLFERALERGRLEHAALYALFAGPDLVGANRFDEVLGQVISQGITARNYTLLGTLHVRAFERPPVVRHVAADSSRADLWCHARASELAGLGRYDEAEDEMLQSTVVTVRWRPRAAATGQQAELRFLQADVAHLRNRYDEAAGLFAELGDWALAAELPGLRARCVWGHAHVLRHQGRDFERALRLFADATESAAAADELFAKAYSITGATGIKVLHRVLPDDEERTLEQLEDEIASTSSHDGYMLEVWKSQAQVAWLRGRCDEALGIIEAAIERAQALNDRLLYNLHFERAEFARLGGDPVAALADYRRVLDFGLGNHDRNLEANAKLGLVLSDLAAGWWLHHGSVGEARAATLDARDVALRADIQGTASAAAAVFPLLDVPPRPSDLRLILM